MRVHLLQRGARTTTPASRVRSMFVCDRCPSHPIVLLDLEPEVACYVTCPTTTCGADMRLVAVGGPLDAIELPAVPGI